MSPLPTTKTTTTTTSSCSTAKMSTAVAVRTEEASPSTTTSSSSLSSSDSLSSSVPMMSSSNLQRNTTSKTTVTTTSTTTATATTTAPATTTTIDTIMDIEELHDHAVLVEGSKTYEDPSTGFTVFTELFHLQRGTCCGNRCRHCPYGWENVPNQSVSQQQKQQQQHPTKVKSGDKLAVQALLNELEQSSSRRAAADSKELKNENENGLVEPCTSKEKKVGGTHGGRLTEKNVPYTKKGDKGTSQLLTGERRSKNDAAFEAMGTVDELCSVVGVVHSLLVERQLQQQQQQLQESTLTSLSKAVDYGELPEWLLLVMSRLFDAGSHIAKPVHLRHHHNDDDDDDDSSSASSEDGEEDKFKADGIGGGMDMAHVEALEDWIDTMTEQLPELRNFILPAGSVTASQLHVCRTVARRAERSVVPLVDLGVCDPNVLKYLNRLSDFLFVASRWCNYCQGSSEIEYRRPEKYDKQRVATAKALTK